MSDVSLVPPLEMIEFDGERCTPWVTSQILAAHLHRYFSALDIVQGKRVLDISCGEGYGSALMQKHGAAHVTGVDLDDKIIARANRVYANDALTFQTADASRPLPFADDSFDVVVSFETIEHITQHDLFASELARVLTPEGVLVISTPDAELSPPDIPNPFHEKELDEAAFLGLLNSQFATVTQYRQGYLHGSVLSGPSDALTSWKRTGFLDYAQDDSHQRRYILATATNGKAATLPTGMLHDGVIVATLNRRIKELEARVQELERSGTTIPQGADET